MKGRVWVLSMIVFVLIGVWLGARWYENKQTEALEQKQASAVIEAYLEQLANVSYQQDDLFAKADHYVVPASLEMDHETQQWFVDRVRQHKLVGQKLTSIKLNFKEPVGNSFGAKVDAIYMMHNDEMNYPEQVNYSQGFEVAKQPNGEYLITDIFPLTVDSIYYR